MSYIWGACGVSRLDRESNEDMYGRFGMSEATVGMDCGVVEWVKQSTLRWYGHVIIIIIIIIIKQNGKGRVGRAQTL